MIFTVVGEKICNLLAVLPTGLTIPPFLLSTKSLHGMIFTVFGGEDLQFVGCLASRVNNPPPLLLFTKSLHEMIFTVVAEKICNLLAVLPALSDSLGY